MYPVRYNNSSQYIVSAASFNAICSFTSISLSDKANCASEILAPMLVPERNT